MDQVRTERESKPPVVRAAPLGVAGLVLCTLILLAPVLIAPIPPIGDYPNHLARMWLLSSADAQASMARFYQVHFDTYTNIAIDLIALSLGKVAGWQAAGRFSIALAVVLPPLGGALLWWSIHRRAHWWMLSFGLLAWSTTLLDAFLNFQIAVGFALLFAAAEPWLLVRPVLVQLAARAAMSAVLLLAHPFGLLFYALLLGALAIGPRWEIARWRPMATRLALAALSVGGTAVLFVLLVPSLPGAGENAGLSTLPADFYQGFRDSMTKPLQKAVNVLFAVRSYSNLVDGATLLIFAAPIGIAVAFRRLNVHAGLAMLTVGLVFAYVICPDSLLGAAWVDARFAIMFMFTLALAVVPRLERRLGLAVAAALFLCLIGRTAFVGSIWHARQADVADVAAALEPVPAGATVMALEIRPIDRRAAPRGRYSSSGENSFRHLPALAVPWRKAFVPSLFAARGKQPLMVVPPYNDLSEPNGGLMEDVHILDAQPPIHMDDYIPQYIAVWPRFDYLLLLGADMPDIYGPFTLPPQMSLVRDTGFARLYRIKH